MSPPLLSSVTFASSGASPEHIENLFHSVDVDGSAEINYNEFVAAAMSKYVTPLLLPRAHGWSVRRITIDEERLMLAFETLDLDNTGFLTKDTIRKALGEHMTEEELNEMVRSPLACLPLTLPLPPSLLSCTRLTSTAMVK
jgi:Ca2+-binding EF-hand superfamily protein